MNELKMIEKNNIHRRSNLIELLELRRLDINIGRTHNAHSQQDEGGDSNEPHAD